ncbi:MAG: 30S ribosomal protein S9 [Acidobacteriota bacterium]|jgi:small subunit ribosomal protein S9
MSLIQYHGVGRRKSSVARVYLRPGKGGFVVNKRPFENYFPNPVHRMQIETPLSITGTQGSFDILVNVHGGGTTGQAGAVRLGISRALLEYNAEFRGKLRAQGLLTRDARKVERKKYGHPKARKRFQFSKR